MQLCDGLLLASAALCADSFMPITGHHMWAVRRTEVQTEMYLRLVNAEKNLLHAPETVKEKENGLQMVIGTASENVMQHHGAS